MRINDGSGCIDDWSWVNVKAAPKVLLYSKPSSDWFCSAGKSVYNLAL
jgi:hypothetical protein